VFDLGVVVVVFDLVLGLGDGDDGLMVLKKVK